MQILASPSHAGDRAELDMQLIQLKCGFDYLFSYKLSLSVKFMQANYMTMQVHLFIRVLDLKYEISAW